MEFLGKHNPKIKEALALKRTKSRKGEFFLVEGVREIRKALDAGYPFQHLLCTANLSEEEESLCQEAAKRSIAIFFCHEESLSELSYKENSGHVIAVVRKTFLSTQEFLASRRNPVPFYLIIEQVEKPGNVGALLRTGDGVGVDGVILCDPIVDLYNPNVIRSSLGTVFTLPVLCASLPEVLQLIRKESWEVYVTSPRAKKLYFEETFLAPTAIVFGSEKDGLTQPWFHERFQEIALPMRGKADSLNLSTSVAAIAYEVLRQRMVSM